jgi:UDPglucose 6-dehydrogenase
MRDAPSLIVVPMLQEKGALVRAFDPQGEKHGAPLLQGVVWATSALGAAKDADVTVVLTEWNEFRALSLDTLKRTMRGSALVDLRNVFQPGDAADAGLGYSSIGRGPVNG